MKNLQPLLLYITAFLCGSGLLLFSACEISSGDEVVREVSLSVAGSYSNSSGIPLQQTGSTITLLSINQSGDQINAVDNLGGIWSGSIGRAEGSTATFTLKGATSAGQEVIITGTIVVNDTTGTLSGTWIEPSLSSAASASATVAAVPTSTPEATATTTATVTATPIE